MTEGKKIYKIPLKRNESFNIREGWMSKGVAGIVNNPLLFSSDDAMDNLGVGSKMVKSIRFWLQATGLTVEKKVKGGHFSQSLTKEFGDIVYEYDRYFEDISTLWLLHANIVSNDVACRAWNLLFSQYKAKEFSRADFYQFAARELDKITNEFCTYSSKLLEDDCASALRMYLHESGNNDPEDNTNSPFGELGLICRDREKNGIYRKMEPSLDKLDVRIVFYLIMLRLQGEKTSVSIESLLTEPNNVGCVFNLNRTLLNEYLDKLRSDGFITINRTAGLDMVYVKKDLLPGSILKEYYEAE